MRKIMLLLFFLVAYTGQLLHAQYYYNNSRYLQNEIEIELGAGVGLMNAFTDLGGKKGIGKNFIKDLNWKNAKPDFSIYAMAVYREWIGLRLEGTFGQVTAYDSILKDVKATTFGRYERNLSFKSTIAEVQLALEFHPLFLKSYDEDEAPYFSPYLVGGVGLFSFDPQAELQGQWHRLQPLRTEGQGNTLFDKQKPYALTQINFAAGIGVKYEVNSFINARFEINHRFLRTDYLDDVSTNYVDPAIFATYLPANLVLIAQQLYSRKAEINPGDVPEPGTPRGDRRDNDAFFTLQLKVGIILGRQKK